MHLTQIKIDTRLLSELAREHRLPISTADAGYRMHVGLTSVFGDAAPKPFWIRDTDGQHADVLGYADQDKKGLQGAAQMHASSLAYEMCEWNRLHCKPMPGADVLEDQALSFKLRACPIVRKGSAGQGINLDGETVKWRAGERMDAFLSQALSSGDDITRSEAYASWLRRQFDVRDGGAEIQSVSLEAFNLKEVTRRAQGTTMKQQTKPMVLLSGRLQVREPEDFLSILSSGLGQHKSFGCGMMLIRPA